MLGSPVGQVARAADRAIRCRGVGGAEPEQRLECRHRLSPPMVSKHELVEVGLKLRLANTVIGADQPLLQIADGAVSQRNDRYGAAAERAPRHVMTSHVADPGRGQSVEALV